jgi:hypothetical protein
MSNTESFNSQITMLDLNQNEEEKNRRDLYFQGKYITRASDWTEDNYYSKIEDNSSTTHFY